MHRTILLVPLIAFASPAVAQDHAGHETGEDQQTMDRPHHQMDEASMGSDGSAADAPIPQGPPPPEALEGPAYAADQSVGAERMNSSRLDVVRKVSGMPSTRASGVCAQSTMFVIMRGPSSSSTTAMA